MYRHRFSWGRRTRLHPGGMPTMANSTEQSSPRDQNRAAAPPLNKLSCSHTPMYTQLADPCGDDRHTGPSRPEPRTLATTPKVAISRACSVLDRWP